MREWRYSWIPQHHHHHHCRRHHHYHHNRHRHQHHDLHRHLDGSFDDEDGGDEKNPLQMRIGVCDFLKI